MDMPVVQLHAATDMQLEHRFIAVGRRSMVEEPRHKRENYTQRR